MLLCSDDVTDASPFTDPRMRIPVAQATNIDAIDRIHEFQWAGCFDGFSLALKRTHDR